MGSKGYDIVTYTLQRVPGLIFIRLAGGVPHSPARPEPPKTKDAVVRTFVRYGADPLDTTTFGTHSN